MSISIRGTYGTLNYSKQRNGILAFGQIKFRAAHFEKARNQWRTEFLDGTASIREEGSLGSGAIRTATAKNTVMINCCVSQQCARSVIATMPAFL
ncbi:hypothetical protein DSM3645_14610 [Blastopirellula marina DSM 3645]|uniref:Uncharacterized protein n=1 Tax=Blastopirellula marina DSM 3645 TaxID=314230 RepID=A3ZSC6_9BACT|nr:hypothetical protein DSM3645_14610 [Blastopirellula marina DSM 3645]